MMRIRALCVLATVMCGTAAISQEVTSPAHKHKHPLAQYPRGSYVWTQAGGSEMDSDDRLEALAELWRDADSDSERDKIEKMATDVLAAQFDADMKQRQEELQKVEKRVARLRSQLDRRSDKKKEILGVQVKQVTMAWDGLGWKDPEHSNRRGLTFAGPSRITGAYNNVMFNGRGGSDTMNLLILDAISREDDEAVEYLTDKFVDKLSEMEPDTVNSILWTMWEETTGEVTDKAYWSALAEAGEDALERFGDSHDAANTWDTVAHLYEELGELDKAIEYQEKAVELSGKNFPGSADGQLTEYLKQLKEKAVR